MKIYASNSDNISFEYFYDTDLWVRCAFSSTPSHKYYIKYQRYIHDDFGIVRIFPAEWLENPDEWSDPEIIDDLINGWIQRDRPANLTEIVVDTPVLALTTQELCDIMGIEL